MAIESLKYYEGITSENFTYMFGKKNFISEDKMLPVYNKLTKSIKESIHINVDRIINNKEQHIKLKDIDYVTNLTKENNKDGNSLTLFLIGNGGPNRFPLTPWMIIHRAFHITMSEGYFNLRSGDNNIFRKLRKFTKNNFYQDFKLTTYEDMIYNIICDKSKNIDIQEIIKNKFNGYVPPQLISKINKNGLNVLDESYEEFATHHLIYNMKSARDAALDTINRNQEIITQFLFSGGKITLRSLDTIPDILISDSEKNMLEPMRQKYEKELNVKIKAFLNYIKKNNIPIIF